MRNRKSALIFLVLLQVSFFSCQKKETSAPVSEDQQASPTFTREEMLRNLADNLISPALQNFAKETDLLYNATLTFTANPDQALLDTLQRQLDKASFAWQYCSWFRYGSARTQFGVVDGARRQDEINQFPVAADKTELYISSANYSLSNADYDTRGLGAVDYLIHTYEHKDSVILAKFSTSSDRKEYLKAIVLSLKLRANAANAAWLSEKKDFLAASGTDENSTVSQIALDIDVDFDNVKNDKVGVPVGELKLGYILPSYPEKTEAYFSGLSVRYIRANVEAIENVWLGRSMEGKDNFGFDDYLDAANAGTITQSTKAQFRAIYARLDALPQGRLSESIKNDKQKIQDLYSELQKLTRYLKSDMVSQLGLSISYASGDGD